MKVRSVVLSFLVVFSLAANVYAHLTVAVAANVQYTFEELKTVFEKDTGIQLKGVIGSSGKFTAQIENGAPFDVFLSADTDYPKTLQKEGLTHNEPRVYGYGTLVLWSLTGVDVSKGLDVLAEGNVGKVAIASPKTAPYGRQAINALKNSQLYDKVQKKLVYGENIAQTNHFIMTKAADVGITAKSIVLAPNMKDQGQWFELDKKQYDPIAQAAVILKHAEKNNLKDAQKFFDFLYSPPAQEILRKYGYILP